MANAGCINAYDCNGCLIQTLQNLDSACIGVGVQYTAPNPLDDKRLDYIKYTDKCGCVQCLSAENEILIYATNGVIKNLTLTNDDVNEAIKIKWNDIFGSNRAKTIVRYKTGSYPVSITDGTLAVEETTKNQYSSTPFSISGVLDETTYYISAFAVDSNDTIIDVQSSSITTDFSKYKLVEYIENNGTAYILSGLNIKDGYRNQMKVRFLASANADSYPGISGGYLGPDNGLPGGQARFYLNGLQTNGRLNYGYLENWGDIGSGLSTGIDYEIDYSWISGNAFVKLNGNTLQSSSKTYSTSLQGQAPVGGSAHMDQSEGNQYRANPGIRIYYSKFYNSAGTLVRDFVPCYRKIDNVIGLLDTVNKVFYTNSGTGSFTKGPDVN